MKAIKEFYDNMDFLDKFQFIFGLMALIIVFSIIIYAICCWIKPPATICLDGHTYVKATPYNAANKFSQIKLNA